MGSFDGSRRGILCIGRRREEEVGRREPAPNRSNCIAGKGRKEGRGRPDARAKRWDCRIDAGGLRLQPRPRRRSSRLQRRGHEERHWRAVGCDILRRHRRVSIWGSILNRSTLGMIGIDLRRVLAISPLLLLPPSTTSQHTLDAFAPLRDCYSSGFTLSISSTSTPYPTRLGCPKTISSSFDTVPPSCRATYCVPPFHPLPRQTVSSPRFRCIQTVRGLWDRGARRYAQCASSPCVGWNPTARWNPRVLLLSIHHALSAFPLGFTALHPSLQPLSRAPASPSGCLS